MAEVKLVNITKSFGAVKAVDDVSLSVEDGELVALLGPSGCGKTTTLRMIVGLEQEDEGEIWVGGKLMSGTPPWRRNCGLVFQNYALFPHMTVADNIAYGLRLRGQSRSEVRRRVQAVAEFLAIGRLLERFPAQLSGGEQQRVAVGRALVIQPVLLLMDEPLTGLDAKLRERVRFELRDMVKKAGITTIYVTHDQEEAFALADRVVVMNSGRIEQTGSPWEVYNHPQSSFVANFIGSNNLIRGVVDDGVAGEGQARVVCQDLSLNATTSWPIGRGRRQVDVIIKTTKIKLGTQPESADSRVNVLRGRIVSTTFVGAMVRLVVDVSGLFLRVELDPAEAELASRDGQHVFLSIRPEDAKCFPAGETSDESNGATHSRKG